MNLDQIVNDFRQMDPNDPSDWPLIPKVVVLVLILAAVVAGGWWFFWQDVQTQIDQAREEQVKLKEEWVGKKRQAVNLDAYKQQLDEMRLQFGALLKQLPNKSEMENLIIDINQAGRGRGLQFDLWKPGNESMKEFYAELPIQLSITGSYHDLGRFAADVAKLPRIVTLTNMSLVPSTAGGIKMDATAMTYRYLDDEEVSKQKRAKAAPKK